MRKYKNEFIKLLENHSRRYGLWKMFSDFCILSATSLSNSIDAINFTEREDLYMNTIKKYRKEDAEAFPKMLALITQWLTEEFCDALGEIYMELSLGNKHAGQFFTPYSVCTLMSEITFNQKHIDKCINENGKVRLSEPAVGAGANVIAFAEIMKKNGINYQKKLEVECNDVDLNPILMSYIQLSLLGIPAVIKHQNTLTLPPITNSDIWITPMYAINNGIIDIHKLNRLRQDRNKKYKLLKTA